MISNLSLVLETSNYIILLMWVTSVQYPLNLTCVRYGLNLGMDSSWCCWLRFVPFADIGCPTRPTHVLPYLDLTVWIRSLVSLLCLLRSFSRRILDDRSWLLDLSIRREKKALFAPRKKWIERSEWKSMWRRKEKPYCIGEERAVLEMQENSEAMGLRSLEISRYGFHSDFGGWVRRERWSF